MKRRNLNFLVVGKGKLKKFEEMGRFDHVLQPAFDEIYHKDHPLKGNWNADFFSRPRPLVLELGCGKGEYTVGLAEKYPEKNFLGIDIKGARMWRGAKTAEEKGLDNVGFLRTRIEFIGSFFGTNEVSEIWITFPDPQLKRRRNKKRLTAATFLNAYNQFLVPGGKIHLKTDNPVLYEYTLDLIRHNGLQAGVATDDLYHSGMADEILAIRTHYEKQFLARGMPIHYLRFSLEPGKELQEIQLNT